MNKISQESKKRVSLSRFSLIFLENDDTLDMAVLNFFLMIKASGTDEFETEHLCRLREIKSNKTFKMHGIQK